MTERTAWRWAVLAVAAAGVILAWNASTPGAIAQNTGSTGARATPVAVVDIPAVLDSLDEKVQREAELQEFLDELSGEVQAVRDEAQSVVEEIEAMDGVLERTDPQFIELRNRLIRLERRFRVEQEIAARLAEERTVQLQIDLYNKIVAATQRYAEDQGFELVISDDSGVELPRDMRAREFQAAIVTRTVVHASAGVNITDEVARRMNNEYAAGP